MISGSILRFTPCMIQALLRLSTFILNAVVLRYIALEVLGVVNMRYDLETMTSVTITHIG